MEDILLRSEFLSELDYLRIFIGILIIFVCTKIIEFVYKNYMHSNDNKDHFVKNMFPFVLAMFIIVSVIKTSIALSLGLVGALSIIRFRTAIKEPGQLINLLILTGIAISVAAEKEVLAIIITIIYSLHSVLIFRNLKNKKIVDEKLLRISIQNENINLKIIFDIDGFNRLYRDVNNVVHVEFNLKSLNDVEPILQSFGENKINYEII
ncbi:DUF4956 domain-containing protein [Flavobacteriaceae bacterium]|nr:DUF4956 domain-containing protein [Flavobacteriaceae bacterium]